jgi:hypothetical protein
VTDILTAGVLIAIAMGVIWLVKRTPRVPTRRRYSGGGYDGGGGYSGGGYDGGGGYSGGGGNGDCGGYDGGGGGGGDCGGGGD